MWMFINGGVHQRCLSQLSANKFPQRHFTLHSLRNLISFSWNLQMEWGWGCVGAGSGGVGKDTYNPVQVRVWNPFGVNVRQILESSGEF